MNWQTENLFEEARALLTAPGGFSLDQVAVLEMVISKIEEAVAKEAACVSAGSVSISQGGHGS